MSDRNDPSGASRRGVPIEQFVRRAIDEFGVFSRSEVETFLAVGGDAVDKNSVERLRNKGCILGVMIDGAWMYPQFQFGEGVIVEAIAPLRRLANRFGWSEVDLIAWLFRETTRLPYPHRPVDHLVANGEEVVRVLEMRTEW